MDYIELIEDAYYPLMDKSEEGLIEFTSSRMGYKPKYLSLIDRPDNPIPYDSINNFYHNLGSCNIEWRATDEDSFPESVGQIQILGFSEVLKNRLFTDVFPEEEFIDSWRLEGKPLNIEGLEYYPLEVLNDGYGTGYFVGNDFEDIIHYRSRMKIESIDVNIDGYVQLLAKTYGLVYWQKVIVDIKNGTRSWEYDKFEENMKVINPNFKLSELEAFYNSIRLNRL